MNIKPLHINFKAPFKASHLSAGYDLYMPEAGNIKPNTLTKVGLGFAAAIPKGYVGLILPRSGMGAKFGLELNNTCGVIDSDYRGEWIAVLRLKDSEKELTWEAGERLLQVVFVPYGSFEFHITNTLDETERNTGGFGSTGK